MKTASNNAPQSTWPEAGNRQPLFMCCYLPSFPVQALMRLRVHLQGQPVAVLQGTAPLQIVCSANTAARRDGVRLGMPRADAESLAGIVLLKRSEREEISAGRVLMHCLASFVPTVERCDLPTAARCVMDISGLGRLHSSPFALCQNIREALVSCGLHASIAVSCNIPTACSIAQGRYGITVVAEGQEAQALAPLLLDVLPLDEEQAETFKLWGIRTLGALASLPLKELIARMGQPAKRLRALARGEHPHLFAPVAPALDLHEELELDSPVVQQEALLFLLSPMLDQLVWQARQRSLALVALTLTLKFSAQTVFEEDDGKSLPQAGRLNQRTIRTAVASLDKRVLLKLIQLDLDAHPPGAPVLSIRLAAEAAKPGTTQAGLFAPPLPELSRLDITLARLESLVGEGRVGSPAIEDSYAPDHFSMHPFKLSAGQSSDLARAATQAIQAIVPAIRCIRPPLPVRVEIHADTRSPSHLWLNGKNFSIHSVCGPWKSSGSWWGNDAWTVECWDVIAESTSASSALSSKQQDHAKQSAPEYLHLYLLQKETEDPSIRLCCRLHREISNNSDTKDSSTWYLWGLYD